MAPSYNHTTRTTCLAETFANSLFIYGSTSSFSAIYLNSPSLGKLTCFRSHSLGVSAIDLHGNVGCVDQEHLFPFFVVDQMLTSILNLLLTRLQGKYRYHQNMTMRFNMPGLEH